MQLRLAPPPALASVVAAAAVAAALLAGCGGIKSPDLFIVQREGSTPHARLTLLVTEEGIVQCNGGPHLRLSDQQIVTARAIQEDLKTQASEHLALPPRSGSVLSYRLRDQDGSVSFADNSAGQPKVFRQLQLFVLQAAQQLCKLPQ
ncbi:MAG TPA: hypothetical protein VGD00_03970 [Solirubrobacteraceae bacterium]|jgi:hypothetical protein